MAETEQKAKRSRQRPADLYLDTVNRKVLDFDGEKVCSTSLSESNVYACLVCSKYFRGRSRDSECFKHSIDEDHHVYVNLDTLRFYVLPENYELAPEVAHTLEDVRWLINPTYTRDAVAQLDTHTNKATDLQGREYTPGFVGMVNFGKNDYSNVVVQALAHVSTLRDYLMLGTDEFEEKELTKRFGLLVRKLWSSHLFKPHVSSAQLIAYTSNATDKRFTAQKSANPRDYMLWLLTHLSRENKRAVSKLFRGATDQSKFWMITLELPPATIFKDSVSADVPQLDLADLIQGKQYKFKKLPPYLIVGVNRTDISHRLQGVNNSDINPTIVKFDPEKLEVGNKMYKLAANVVLVEGEEVNDREDVPDGLQEGVHYKVQIEDRARNKWMEIDDLAVKETEKGLLFLNHTCLQIWRAT